MAKTQSLPTTQRAYTLRLRGVDPTDNSWRDALWATHEAVNKGAKVFGDWLLTLRGGLGHTLADAKIPQGKGKPDRDPTNEERRARRILLALSWLSVESKRGSPSEHIVPHDFDKQSGACSNWKTVESLKDILKKRGLGDKEIQEWEINCKESLEARIRDDAVWVNRSEAFDEVCSGQKTIEEREDARTALWFLLTAGYLVLPEMQAKEPKNTQEQDDEESAKKAATEAIAKSGEGAGTRTRQAFTNLFGTSAIQPVFSQRDHWRDHLAERLRDIIAFEKLPLPRSGYTRTELQREMFSKAASRLAQIHTKQKQQEIERQNRKAADEALKALEADAQFKPALDLLDALCIERGVASGAQEEYRIRPRQIDGWDRIVKAWESTAKTVDPTAAEEQRIEAAKRLQDEERDKKFGDVNLFMSLAEDKCKPIWWHDNQSNLEILKTYVKGKKARADAVRLKVAAFRHPDTYFNPVFCQFGVSRPRIKFRRLRSFTSKPEGRDARAVGLLLWDGNNADLRVLHAVSKRLDREIGTSCDTARNNAANLVDVARRTRLSIASVAKTPGKDGVHVAKVFDLKDKNSRQIKEDVSDNDGVSKKEPTWNGTLFGDRRALETIGRLLEDGKKTEAEKRNKRLHWWLIVSLKLQTVGPWYEYIDHSQDLSPFQRTVRKDEEKGQKRKKGTKYISWDGWTHEETNKPLEISKNNTALVTNPKSQRKGMAALVLCRLPGLRVLSVDLGHRYAAACAVWEALTAKQMKDACRAAGHAAPKQEDLYLHLKTIGDNGKEKTDIYRRIGPDTLPKVNSHPASWARLDRQFLIKLQGEDRVVRKAGLTEVAAVQELEKAVGRESPDRRSLRVDDLMSETVRTVRLALQRHGCRARIAFNLTASEKHLPGGREEALTGDGHIALLADTLADWYALFIGKGWTDEWAKQQWESHVTPLLQCAALPHIPEDGEATPKARKKYRADLIENLKPAAESLAKNNSLCRKLHNLWAARWREDNAALRKRLRWLRDWLLPRGKKAKADRAIRHVGGLSLTRIATIKSLYQVQKAFHMRPEPDDPRKNIPAKGDDALRDFGRSILDVMEHMREQRVKQLASRIVEAALGVGRVKIPKKGKMPKRPRARKDQPCHSVVIENLTHYRPEETRTRRENRQLMSWSSGKVKKFLAEACQLHGLHLREVSAAHTSRQDSRTGSPGVRCSDVAVIDFLSKPWWRKQVSRAKEKTKNKNGNALERYLLALDEKWSSASDDEIHSAKPLRIPVKGGELFMSADEYSPLVAGIQADINAAANIGLRALMDPDFPGKWWYVPCDPDKREPKSDKVKGSILDGVGPLQKVTSESNGANKKQNSRKKENSVVNLWRDPQASAIRGVAGGESWEEWSTYWNGVEYRVVQYLRNRAGLPPE